MKHSY